MRGVIPVNECDSTKLRDLADGRLRHAEQVELEQHLEHCADCQRELTESVGDVEDWQIVATALQDFKEDEGSELEILQCDPICSTTPRSTSLESFLRLLGPTDHPDSAGRIGQFEILGVIGAGGMGVVVKAREPALDRIVAIKLLAPHLSSSKSARSRFEREARAAASVIHDNVIEIYQVGEWNGIPFLVMPYVPGPSLQDRIDAEAPFDVETMLVLATQIAKGLSAAHSQGLVHRDVKPSNVLISTGTERAVITDFGLARTADDASLTSAGVLAGTPSFMSPEQARGEEVDQKSDIFSLGSLLFAMAVGRSPCEAESGSEAIRLVARNKLARLQDFRKDLPDWFYRLVGWLNASSPDDRPQSADEVAMVCEKCVAVLRQPNLAELPSQLVDFGGDRNLRKQFALVALVITSCLVFAILGWELANGLWQADMQTPPFTGIEESADSQSDEKSSKSNEHSQNTVHPASGFKQMNADEDSPEDGKVVVESSLTWEGGEEVFQSLEQLFSEIDEQVNSNW